MKYFEWKIRGRCAWIWIKEMDFIHQKKSFDGWGELGEVLVKIEGEEDIEAVVLNIYHQDFMGGKGLEFLLSIERLGVWENYERAKQQLSEKIENFSKPIVAAIEESCVGMGLSLALACDYRLATANTETYFSFPAVKLGLIPSGGVSQRLPRLIGIRPALNLMVTGNEINVYEAEKIGLVDKLVHPYQLELAAQQQALELVGKKIIRKTKSSSWDKWMEKTGLGRSVMLDEARQKVHQSAYGNYPAPLKIIECVEMGYKYGIRAGYELELRSMDEMVTHPIAKQLIQTFLTMNSKKKNPLVNYTKEVSKIGIIGAGKMGEHIARDSLLQGFEVILKDVSEQTLRQTQSNIWKYLANLGRNRFISTKKKIQLISNLYTVKDYKGFSGADMVIDVVFENKDLKQEVMEGCMAEIPEHCIYAINTSAIAISDIAQTAAKPSQIIGMRYFSPILKSALLEIVVTKQTAKWVIATAIEVGIQQGKTPIVVKDTPGFYTSRILAVLLNEALLLLEEGGDILQVDEAAKQLGFAKGVFELVDEMGIDVGAHMMSGQLLQFFRRRQMERKVSMGLVEMYGAGYRGRKNLNGFYSYHSKTGKRKIGVADEDVYDFFGGVEKERTLFKTKQIRQRLMMAVVNEAAHCLEEGTIFSPEDGDLGAIMGLGFPAFTGGPFRYLDSLGAAKALTRLNKLKEKFGVRFTAARIIEEMSLKNQLFYEDNTKV